MSGAAERSPGGFVLKSKFRPTGDQPEAIAALYEGLRRGEDRLVLQGVTGSGKTFTMANLIAKWGRPTLILSHNKTLAAQLFAELKEFFPRNAVEYFISYYDYYQPEAYIPQTDTYIEKDASVNEEIERYRLAATNALIARRDVIVVASVSCSSLARVSVAWRCFGPEASAVMNGRLISVEAAEESSHLAFSAASSRSACAATLWTSSPPTRRRRSASSSSATRSTPSASSTP